MIPRRNLRRNLMIPRRTPRRILKRILSIILKTPRMIPNQTHPRPNPKSPIHHQNHPTLLPPPPSPPPPNPPPRNPNPPNPPCRTSLAECVALTTVTTRRRDCVCRPSTRRERPKPSLRPSLTWNSAGSRRVTVSPSPHSQRKRA